MLEKIWTIVGTLMEIESVRCMDRFHKIHCIGWKTTGWIYVVLEEDWQENKRPPDQTFWGQRFWDDMSHASKRKEKQKWAIGKPKLDSTRNLRGIYFIDLDDEEFKDVMKNARRKLEVPMPAAILCWIQREKYRETCRVDECKTKYVCIVETGESTRKRLEGSLHKYHGDHVAGKGFIFWVAPIWCTNFLMLQALKMPGVKQQWIKNGENWRKSWHGSWRKSETRSDRRSKEWEQNCTLCVVNGFQSSQEFGVGSHSFKHTNVESYSEVTLWKMTLDLMQYLQNKDHQHHKWRQQKVVYLISRLLGCAGQAADVVSAYTQVKMEDAPKLSKIPKSECPDIWIRLPRHKWPKSWSSVEDPVVPLWKESVRSSFGRTVMGKANRESSIGTRLGKVPNWECLFVDREKGLFLAVYVDDIRLAWKKQNIDTMRKLLMKEVDLGETTSFLDHVCLGCTQRECQASKDIGDNYRSMFVSKISAEATEERRKHFFTVLWHGRSCKEMCGAILWVGKENNLTTFQSRNTMHWRPPIQGRKNGICRRTVKGLLTNCLNMIAFGPHW